MGRAAIEPGRWGKISLIRKIHTANGKWIAIPEGERGKGDPRRWLVVPERWRATTRVLDVDDGQLRQVSRYSRSKTTAEALLRIELEGRQAQRAAKSRRLRPRWRQLLRLLLHGSTKPEAGWLDRATTPTVRLSRAALRRDP